MYNFKKNTKSLCYVFPLLCFQTLHSRKSSPNLANSLSHINCCQLKTLPAISSVNELTINRLNFFYFPNFKNVCPCAADFSLLNLPKGKSLGRSKPATNS